MQTIQGIDQGTASDPTFQPALRSALSSSLHIPEAAVVVNSIGVATARRGRALMGVGDVVVTYTVTVSNALPADVVAGLTSAATLASITCVWLAPG